MSTYPQCMVLRPIQAWPGAQTRERVRSTFSASWSATLGLLDRELHHLGNGWRRPESVLQIAMQEKDFRLDGMPRANAVAAHPGVILSIDSTKGHLSFPCDKFDRWQDNLRAIALSLEALRKVDRYGTTPNHEQYTGWRAIESAAPSVDKVLEAALLLRATAWPEESLASREVFAPKIATDPTIATNTYRQARAKSHPDRNHGDQTAWDAVEAAANTLRAAGVSL